jgi:hypothetical protein
LHIKAKEGVTMKIRGLMLAQMVVFLTFTCLFTFHAYARQVTCPRCGGAGVIPGPVLHGLQSYYGCPQCGGSGGGGSPGVKGRGWIEVPDAPQPDVENIQPDNTEAERQAAEAERQRALAEQQKKAQEEDARRQAEFDKAKQDALRSMKGITEKELGLKGASTGGDLGLKGIGETKASELGLKGVGTSTPPAWNDASVVDLRDKKQPLVVDPNIVKGNTAPSQTPTAIPPEMSSSERDQDIAKTQSYLFSHLFPGREQDGALPISERDEDIAKTQAILFSRYFEVPERSGVFPKNPEEPLINPLREPERYKAWEASVQARLEAQAGCNKPKEIIRQMDQDPTLNAARDRIVKEEAAAINAAHARAMKELGQKFDAFRKANDLKDFQQMLQKEKDDPAFKQQSQAIVDDYWKKIGAAESEARQHSLHQMQAEVAMFAERHPKIGKGKNP